MTVIEYNRNRERRERECNIYDYALYLACASLMENIHYRRDELEPVLGRLDRIELTFRGEATEAGGE